jgi:hypothetical protein
MMDRTTRIATGGLLAAALLVGWGGCGNGGDGATAEPARLPDVEVPTQEQADAAAQEEMNQENADEIMQDLDRELDEELYGDG